MNLRLTRTVISSPISHTNREGSAFRLSTIPSAAARFSGDAGLDAPSTLLLTNVVDRLLGKGRLM
jgi:hypothetical protein